MMDWLRRLRGVILIFFFLSLFLYVISLNFRDQNEMDLLQRIFVETIAPLASLGKDATSGVTQVADRYILLRQLKQENEDLKDQVGELKKQVTGYYEAYLENLRLRRLLDFKNSLRDESIVAPVVMHDPTGWFQTLIVAKGEAEGVAPDMPVLSDEGVVGRVLDVSSNHSRVLLVTSPASAVDVLIQRNRVRGVLSGKGENRCVLKYVRGNLDVRKGDLVITSGKDGIFRKGLRLGVVERAVLDPLNLFQQIDVRPSVRISVLEEVLIVKQEPLPWAANQQ